MINLCHPGVWAIYPPPLPPWIDGLCQKIFNSYPPFPSAHTPHCNCLYTLIINYKSVLLYTRMLVVFSVLLFCFFDAKIFVLKSLCLSPYISVLCLFCLWAIFRPFLHTQMKYFWYCRGVTVCTYMNITLISPLTNWGEV